MEKRKYLGNSDVIRHSKNYKWIQMKEDELLENKEYDILGSCCMQRVWIMKDDKFVSDDSGERYLYLKVKNEDNQEVLVWDGFFDGKTL